MHQSSSKALLRKYALFEVDLVLAIEGYVVPLLPPNEFPDHLGVSNQSSARTCAPEDGISVSGQFEHPEHGGEISQSTSRDCLKWRNDVTQSVQV